MCTWCTAGLKGLFLDVSGVGCREPRPHDAHVPLPLWGEWATSFKGRRCSGKAATSVDEIVYLTVPMHVLDILDTVCIETQPNHNANPMEGWLPQML